MLNIEFSRNKFFFKQKPGRHLTHVLSNYYLCHIPSPAILKLDQSTIMADVRFEAIPRGMACTHGNPMIPIEIKRNSFLGKACQLKHIRKSLRIAK